MERQKSKHEKRETKKKPRIKHPKLQQQRNELI